MSRKLLAALLASAALAACGEENPTTPTTGPSFDGADASTLAAEVRSLAAGRGIVPLVRPAAVRPELVQLGQALAFDKILSGNRDISCMTCHLPTFGTGDGLRFSIGAGGTGLGPARTHPDGALIPRNAPPAFNLFALNELFWDGRVAETGGAFVTPAGQRLNPHMTDAFEFGPVSAQPMFPVLSREEMRGASGNELAAMSDKQAQQIWKGLMDRLGRIREYREMFEAAYPGKRFAEMSFAYAGNAMAGFFVEKLSFNDSPWDRFLAGDDAAMTDQQLRGAKAFMSARCSICHNGPAFTDNAFHNVAVAQIGPGRGDGPGGRDDFGRAHETGLQADKYAFRTSPLRNVELTAPYGHDGAYNTLRDFVAHYSESDLKLRNFDASTLGPQFSGTLLHNFDDVLATRDPLLDGVVFDDPTIDDVTEFMKALTDPAARDLAGIVPARVPSGLSIDH